MKHLKILIAFIGFLLMASPAVNVITEYTQAPKALIAVGVVLAVIAGVALTKSKHRNVHLAGVEVELWVNYLIERFWKDNAFLKNTFDDSQYVLAGKVVHIPQIGAKPEVIKNRNSFPAVAVGRADTDVSYILEPYTTTPTHIQDAEKYESSYNKIDSVLGDHASAVNEAVAEDMIVKWLTGLAGGAKLATTGASAGATAPGATGNVKLFTSADLRIAMTKFNNDGVPKANRFVMPSANMLDHLIQSMSDTQYKDFSSYLDAKEGVIGKLFGFTFLERSSVAVVDNTAAVKPVGAVSATTDKEVTLIWQKDSLASAVGEVKFFDNINDPQYYGDIYSTLLRAGGRVRRSDSKGIIQLSQATGA